MMRILYEKLQVVAKELQHEKNRELLYQEIGKCQGKYEWARIIMLIAGKKALMDGEKVSFNDIYRKYGMDKLYESGAFRKAIGTALTGKGGNKSPSCKVEEMKNELDKFNKGKYNWQWTLEELINYIYNNEAITSNSKENLERLKEICRDFTINNERESINTMDNSVESIIVKVINTNKQLIFTGAPGTGKTFSARNKIADKLFEIEEEDLKKKEQIKKIQMDMVQFHPSYDYTDFIEGIRPNLSGQNVGYTLKNGSFKRFCRRAGVIERMLAAGEDAIDDSKIGIFLQGEDEEIKTFWKNYLNTKEGTVSIKDIDLETQPKFLFIIDEINRAEISKVFGEIMFCLDTDYRGVKGKITTQYASLETDESFFIDKDNDKFFIPSNVYIIGTMNDIDRSVEVFDFALRRRFAWLEFTAEDVMETVLKEMGVNKKLGQEDYSDYLCKIKELNNSICSILKLNRHYYLGPSYFAKIKLYMNNGYKKAREEVWNNHISQILKEYVKGKRTESEIEDIGKAFKA